MFAEELHLKSVECLPSLVFPCVSTSSYFLLPSTDKSDVLGSRDQSQRITLNTKQKKTNIQNQEFIAI